MVRVEHTVSPSICVTVDYELFGDGSGDIQAHLLSPTVRLLNYFSYAGIRATFFVEVAELLVFAETIGSSRCPASLANDYSAVLHQIERMFVEGHDVQLHVHPQWMGAFWNGEFWQFRSFHRSLHLQSPEALEYTLKQGKLLLESIGGDVNTEYICRVFRAGGFHLDRTPEIVHLLQRVGFEMDSSVCRGYYRLTEYANIDYRDLIDVRVPYWYFTDGVVMDSDGCNLIEIPVWSLNKRQLSRLYIPRLMSKLAYRRVRRDSYQREFGYDDLPRTFLGMLSWLTRMQAISWDFCLLSGKQLVASFSNAMDFHQVNSFFPLVMIGHSKEARSLGSLIYFCQHVNERNVQWITLSQALKRINGIERSSGLSVPI